MTLPTLSEGFLSAVRVMIIQGFFYGARDDIVYGGAGDDYLSGDDGDDILLRWCRRR